MSIFVSVIKNRSGKLIRQSLDFPHQLILPLRTTPGGEALLREKRSKFYKIAALRSLCPLASGCRLPEFQINRSGNIGAWKALTNLWELPGI